MSCIQCFVNIMKSKHLPTGAWLRRWSAPWGATTSSTSSSSPPPWMTVVNTAKTHFFAGCWFLQILPKKLNSYGTNCTEFYFLHFFLTLTICAAIYPKFPSDTITTTNGTPLPLSTICQYMSPIQCNEDNFDLLFHYHHIMIKSARVCENVEKNHANYFSIV